MTNLKAEGLVPLPLLIGEQVGTSLFGVCMDDFFAPICHSAELRSARGSTKPDYASQGIKKDSQTMRSPNTMKVSSHKTKTHLDSKTGMREVVQKHCPKARCLDQSS